MKRVKFKREMQRKFLEEVMNEIGSPSLKELSRRIDINYSTLKNYYAEDRLIPEYLFEILIKLGKLPPKITFIEDNWGQIAGGKKGKRK